MIDRFDKKYYFLSNFFSNPITYEGLVYQNAEAAFQSAKCKDDIGRLNFTKLPPNQAKRLGRRTDLREDWEDIKDGVMLDVVRAKFKDEKLKKWLLDTGDEYLIEGNTWGDKYWGQVNGVGKNKLGLILMQVREELAKE